MVDINTLNGPLQPTPPRMGRPPYLFSRPGRRPGFVVFPPPPNPTPPPPASTLICSPPYPNGRVRSAHIKTRSPLRFSPGSFGSPPFPLRRGFSLRGSSLFSYHVVAPGTSPVLSPPPIPSSPCPPSSLAKRIFLD